MSSANAYLKLILFWQGLGYIIVAIPWVFDETAGRLLGVSWLERVLAVVPYLTVDDKVGILWGAAGLTMMFGGSRWCDGRKSYETAAYVAGITVPLLTGAVFGAAFLLGEAPKGYISLISYTLFTVPLFMYLRVAPGHVCEPTPGDDMTGMREDEQ